MTIAYQGAPGAFSHEACLAFVPDHRPIGLPSFADVVAAVLHGEAERGILPIENSRAGPVRGNGELLAQQGIAVIATYDLAVRMHLLALPAARLEDVTMIVSHPMALAQCASKLRTLGIATGPATNTALAAQGLATLDRAVLASEAAASVYGLTILRRDMHDDPDNMTRFCLFERGATGS